MNEQKNYTEEDIKKAYTAGLKEGSSKVLSACRDALNMNKNNQNSSSPNALNPNAAKEEHDRRIEIDLSAYVPKCIREINEELITRKGEAKVKLSCLLPHVHDKMLVVLKEHFEKNGWFISTRNGGIHDCYITVTTKESREKFVRFRNMLSICLAIGGVLALIVIAILQG